MTRLVLSPATPGELLKRPRQDSSRKRSSMGRAPRVLDGRHLNAVRQCPCLKCGLDPAGIAAHVRMNSSAFGKRTGLGEKPDDCWTVPLCRDDHDEQHRIGELQFWHDLDVNPLHVAKRLADLSPDISKMVSAIHAFRAGIET